MNNVRLTWLGHSCFEVLSKDRLLIDPFLDNNPAATVRSTQVEPDFIAVTHGHFDHLGDTVRIARRTGCRVACIHELSQYLRSRNVLTEGMNIGGSITLGDIALTMTDACHSSSIDEAGHSFDGGKAAGFIIRVGDVCIYHAGDTGLFRDMQMIGDLYKPDVAIVPIGGRYTMDAYDAALAVSMLRPKVAIPMHYNTYDRISQDPSIFTSYVKKASGINVIILKVNDSIEL
ncbi:metal-dependent hydrolase [Methanolobus sp.]|uniref:metal-dependent hydrolase n=1 Tax=Methanolobus sp. TaxID=1874737 RepID=UPI0025E58EE5|nr:metal-dependent hydrolase [Methanolobus sp.]